MTPAGNKYSFRAGPKGVRMYELRKRALFRHGTAGEADIDGWVRKREHKSVFFDLETAPRQTMPRMNPSFSGDGFTSLATNSSWIERWTRRRLDEVQRSPLRL